MVSITQTQFRQKAISSLEKDSGGKVKLSGPQETILLAAYGVYSREVGILDKKKSEIIKELEVDMVKEQARTALALTWSSETAQKFGNFLVTPIHEWGRQLPVPQLDREGVSENFSKMQEIDADVVEGQVVFKDKVSDDNPKRRNLKAAWIACHGICGFRPRCFHAFSVE